VFGPGQHRRRPSPIWGTAIKVWPENTDGWRVIPRSPFGVRRTTLVPLAGGLVALLLGGCGGAGSGSAGNTVVDVQERDFRIAAPERVAAGNVTLRAHNSGPDQHELLVVRTESKSLPIRSDGFTVNEEAVQHSERGVLEPGESGSTRDLQLHLAPGHYVLFCNMAGHYLGGMHTNLVVTQ